MAMMRTTQKRGDVYLCFIRSVAQPGSASVLGAECRGFESLHSDHFLLLNLPRFLFSSNAPIAQLDRAPAF